MELRRRKRRRQTADAADVNGAGRAKAGDYYAALSRRMGIAKWAMIVALPVFLAVMLSVYRSNITYDNLKYLMRDFSSDRGEAALKFTDISFEEQTSLDSLIFRGELAVVGSSNVTLYNSTGIKPSITGRRWKIPRRWRPINIFCATISEALTTVFSQTSPECSIRRRTR